MANDKINCIQCKHFYVTWDKNNPRGCKAMGFKTKRLPADVVKQTSGTDCLRYEPKVFKNKE